MVAGGVQRLMGKGNERTFWGDRNVVHLHRCLDYTGTRICQSSSNGGLKICILHLLKNKNTTNNIELYLN